MTGLDETRDEKLRLFQENIGYRFNDIEWLTEALTHSSKRNEGPKGMPWNEKLEFLGDAALNYVIARYLFDELEGFQEGILTELRKCLVDKQALSMMGEWMGVRDVLDIGNSLRAGDGISKSVLGDATEAVLGAIVKDGDLKDLMPIVLRWFSTTVSDQSPIKTWLGPTSNLVKSGY